MFLPGLLVRDYGYWGWLAFMIPNILGAAAMGWLLTKGSSERLTRDHRNACVAFSLVTIAFHLHWLGWFVRDVLGTGTIVATVAIIFVIALAGGAGGWRDRYIALGVLAVSLGVLLVTRFLDLPRLYEPSIKMSASHAFVDKGLMWLTPVMVFGFALCPYFDLTFHQAAQVSSKLVRRTAFTLGFCVMFFFIVKLSLDYASVELLLLKAGPRLWSEQSDAGTYGSVLRSWATILPWHIAVQIAFTLVVHGRQVALSLPDRAQLPKMFVGCLAMAVIVGFLSFNLPMPRAQGMSNGEVGYRIFMGFYGLVFPAYAWIIMIPRRKIGGAPTKSDLLWWIVPVVFAMPFYWMGMIALLPLWFVPGLGAVLLVGVYRMVTLRKQLPPPSDGPLLRLAE
jgi:hypothetical protein